MDSYWQKVEEAVVMASEMPNAEYQLWLSKFCDGDEKLRAEIESFFPLDSEIGDFLEKGGGVYSALLVSEEENEVIGKQLGNYKIIREIGHGGMGAVFLAERIDGEFEQKVAIKIIRQAIAESEIINRFKRERQILASLNHPNIAKLLDGGVLEDGLPFLAMEFIEGKTISEFADEKDLSVEDRLKLFVKICSAVTYAHQNLVVHRDLKPGNILVTVDGEPKLLDFGLAKLLEENVSSIPAQTQTAFRALTPAYASPEQLKGEPINTASDIYSLGVVLYELLTNERPFHFEGKSLDEIIKTVTDSHPPLPSNNPKSKIQNPKLKGDLDNIILMSLRKEPERRYQSVEKFSTDIKRHLKGLPVSARPNTFKYRAEKYFKRHKFGVLAASLIFLSLIVGIIATVWQARRAEIQRARAEKRFGEVRKLSNSLMFEIHDSVQNLQGSTPTRQLIVSRALEYLDSLAQESGDDSGLQIELATAYQKIGDIQGNPYSANLGDTSGALKSYQKSVSILENLHNSQTTPESQSSLGKSYRALGDVLEVEGNVDGCVNNYRRSLEIFENLAAQDTSQTEVLDELARSYETLGDGLSRMENGAAEKLQNYQKNLKIRQDLVTQNPDNRKFQRSLALAYLKVGITFEAKQPEAIENLKKSIVILEDLSKSDSTNARARREVGFAYSQLGNIFTQAHKFTEALEIRHKAFAIRQEIAANDPQNKQAQFDLGTAYADLSESLTNIGETAPALVNSHQSQEIMENLSKVDVDNAIYRRNVALSYEKSALAYEQAAKNEKLSVAERVKNWKASRDWYQKGKQVFTELQDRNELQPRDAAQIERFNDKIINCEKSITELVSMNK